MCVCVCLCVCVCVNYKNKNQLTFFKKGFTRQLQEKAMATHSSTIAWKIPWTEEPGRLQSMGSLKVGHD